MYILQMQKDKRWGRDLGIMYRSLFSRKSEKYQVLTFLEVENEK